MANSKIEDIKGIGPKAAKTLTDCGFNTVEKLANASADELSQLPGIGLATAEKLIVNAKEALSAEQKPVTKIPAKKSEVTPKTKDLDKEDIPKPPTLKKQLEEEKVHPSVKIPKPSTKSVKAPSPKASIKKPADKPKKAEKIVKGISPATLKAIEEAPETPKIKAKGSKKKSKKGKKVSLSKTYGIVHSILHDSSGKSANRSIILHLYETEMPLNKYLGRKVRINLPQSEKHLIGKISRIHGKEASRNKAVIVRFDKGVSPHIVSAKANIQ